MYLKNKRNMSAHKIFFFYFKLELSKSFNKWHTFDVTYCASKFNNTNLLDIIKLLCTIFSDKINKNVSKCYELNTRLRIS